MKTYTLAKQSLGGIALVAAGGLLSACGSLSTVMPKVPSAQTAQTMQPVQLDFLAMAGNQIIGCGDKLQLGSPKTEATLADLRFYVSNLMLIKANGERVPVSLTDDAKQVHTDAQGKQVALIDLENNQGGCMSPKNSDAMHPSLIGKAPAGSYVGISFDVGVPNNLNHIDTTKAPAPLDIAAMAWSWQAGKKYLKAEVVPTTKVTRPETATSPDSMGEKFMVHLGATGCEGNPAAGERVNCLRPNIMPVSLPQLNPQTQAVAVDVAALFNGTDIRVDNGGAMGCMSAVNDPECPGIFKQLGMDLQSGKSAGTQQLFKAVIKHSH